MANVDAKVKSLRYEVRWACNGELIDMQHYSTRLRDAHVAWVIHAIGRCVDWPVHYLEFCIGERVFRYKHRLCERDRTPLLDLHTDRRRKLRVLVVKESPPEMFWDGECICMFPGFGCCVTGRTDALRQRCEQSLQWGEEYHYECWWCGNNGTCRCANCGCDCCEEEEQRAKRAKRI